MVPTDQSDVMVQTMPTAQLVIYHGSGHGVLFQHANAFGREVLALLRG